MNKATATIADTAKTGASAPAKRVRRSAEETRNSILVMANQLFRERGFSNVAIADIAAALSMSPANVFKHFHSKIDLIDEIVQQLVNKMANEVETLDSSHHPVVRIRNFVQRLMDNHYADYQQNPYIFELLLLTAERELQCGQHYRDVIATRMAQILSDAKDQGIYHLDDPSKEADTILFMCTGVLHPVAFTNNDIEKLRLTCDSIVDYIDRALKNPLDK